MGIDLKKMRERMTTLKNGGKKSGKGNFWRPQDGDQTIRIVPTADGDPFRDYWFHYNIGDTSFLSPKKNFGEDDPLDNFIRSLWKENTEDSIKMAKELGARQRFFCPVIVRGEEDQGVRVWGFGRTAYETILNLILNPEYGDITDVDTGTDLTLNYGKPAGASYPQTKITPKRRSSPLMPTPGEVSTLLESVPNLDDLYERKTPEQVQVILDNYLTGEADAEELSSETTQYSQGGNSVEKAFQDLLSS